MVRNFCSFLCQVLSRRVSLSMVCLPFVFHLWQIFLPIYTLLLLLSPYYGTFSLHKSLISMASTMRNFSLYRNTYV